MYAYEREREREPGGNREIRRFNHPKLTLQLVELSGLTTGQWVDT